MAHQQYRYQKALSRSAARWHSESKSGARGMLWRKVCGINAQQRHQKQQQNINISSSSVCALARLSEMLCAAASPTTA